MILETQVNITIKMNPVNINKWGNKFGKDGISELENRLKLTSALGITNMHMFNENGKMQKFKDIDEIIDQWFPRTRSNLCKTQRLYAKETTKRT